MYFVSKYTTQLHNLKFLQDHFIDGITNGAQWFSISGGMQDYNYVQSNAFEITLDLGCERAPNASKLRKYWQDNRRALISLIQQVRLIMETTTIGK